MLAGAVLHSGRIAEMKTGEGKTLVATLPLYLNALEGKGAHLVTPNDYLSRLGGGWMGPIYHALGLSVGVIAHEFAGVYDPDFRRSAQTPRRTPQSLATRCRGARPIKRTSPTGPTTSSVSTICATTWCWEPEQKVQRELHYAIVDEVDNILVDEARTPLIISGPAEEANKLYERLGSCGEEPGRGAQARTRARIPIPNADVIVDEKFRVVTPTERGIDKVEAMLRRMNAEIHGQHLRSREHRSSRTSWTTRSKPSSCSIATTSTSSIRKVRSSSSTSSPAG